MLLNFLIVITVLSVSLAGLTLCFYVFLRTVPRSRRSDRELPFVSVVVPARNEEAKVGRCIESLTRQNYPNLEIISIDDRSIDRTGEIIKKIADRDSRVKFVQGKDLPAGWIGKCNALVHAYSHASGDWLVFTDADTCHLPNSIRDAVSYALDNGLDMVSFMPMQELGSLPERLVMPVLLGSFHCGDPFHTVNDPKNERAYAYGQYIMIRRSVYEAVGGHQSIRDEIVEDHALARLVKEKGYRLEEADGRELYKVRMYLNWESLWHGWTKNLYCLIECKLAYLFLILSLLYICIVGPFASLTLVAQLWLTGNTEPPFYQLAALAGLQMSTLWAWYKLTSGHYEGVRWYHFFFLPLGVVVVTPLYLHSAYLVLSGAGVKWKGRQYTVNSTTKTIEPLAGALDSQLEPALAPEPRD